MYKYTHTHIYRTHTTPHTCNTHTHTCTSTCTYVHAHNQSLWCNCTCVQWQTLSPFPFCLELPTIQLDSEREAVQKTYCEELGTLSSQLVSMLAPGYISACMRAQLGQCGTVFYSRRITMGKTSPQPRLAQNSAEQCARQAPTCTDEKNLLS